MKIALISGGYPTLERQYLVFVQQLVEKLIDLGVEITVIAPQSIDHSIVHRESMLPYKNIHRTKSNIEYIVYRPKYFSFGGRGGMLGKLSYYTRHRGIFKILDKIQYDCIYTHFWENCLQVYKYCNHTRTPLFIACGEGDNALETMVKTMSKAELTALKKAVAGVISVSTENKRKCIDFNLVEESNIIVLPNCVDENIFSPQLDKSFRKEIGLSEEDFLVMFVGGFIERKGPDRVARAINMLNDPNIKSIFVGKFFDGEKIDPICQGIIHKGPLHHDNLPKYLNIADVFVLPTLKEGCSNAIVEALAMGVPVISSDGAFNDDILDEKNSIRLDPNDVDAIASAIRKLKDDKDLRIRMSEYSLSRHEEYSILGRAKKIISFIKARI